MQRESLLSRYARIGGDCDLSPFATPACEAKESIPLGGRETLVVSVAFRARLKEIDVISSSFSPQLVLDASLHLALTLCPSTTSWVSTRSVQRNRWMKKGINRAKGGTSFPPSLSIRFRVGCSRCRAISLQFYLSSSRRAENRWRTKGPLLLFFLNFKTKTRGDSRSKFRS